MAQPIQHSALQSWLQSNGVQELYPIFESEEIDNVEDLLLFTADELKKKLLEKGAKLGKIAKLLRALTLYRSQGSNQAETEEKKGDVQHDPNCKQFVYEHDFDANGIFYAFGTDFGQHDYKNPINKLKFFWGGDNHRYMTDGSHDTGFVGRDDEGTTIKTDAKDVWYGVDVQPYRIKLTRYTLRSCFNFWSQRRLNWELQASNDKQQWMCLSRHERMRLQKNRTVDDHDEHDAQLIEETAFSSTYTWVIDAAKRKYYRYFRVMVIDWKANDRTQQDRESNYVYLNLSGLELYGSLKST